MIDFINLRAIAEKELRDALRNRWFILFTVAFAGLALALSALSQPNGGQLRAASYSRTAASLVNLVLLFVPLIGLTLGASNLAGDRETGALTYLLAQPVNRAEVLFGKYCGMSAALLAALTLGFGAAGVALALQGGVHDAGSYLFTVGLAFLLALSMLSVGFLVSIIAQKTATALGGALFVWLALVFVGDLGLMGAAIVTQMPVHILFLIAAVNPLQMFKIASILTLQANLEVLGAAGMYATDQFGTLLLPMMLFGLVLWVVVPLGGALLLFSRQEKFMLKGSLR